MTMDDLGPDDMDGLMNDLANDYIDLAKCVGLTGSETHEEIKSHLKMLYAAWEHGGYNG
jgi:hypothetical protein